MEASITAFCPELSLGNNLEEKTERTLPKVMHILRSHLHLFTDNELYRQLSKTEQEPKEPPQDLLVLNGNSKWNSFQKYILTSCVFLYQLCFVWCCWDYKNIVLIHKWKNNFSNLMLTHLKDAKQNNNRRWRTNWRQEGGVLWKHCVLKSYQ